ncbi:MAG: SWIM zinc finger domain-containing protein [Gemmataceae bacterium]|nr:SWIM zinc finger domain-containing protein [Gemmataceae bacterium]
MAQVPARFVRLLRAPGEGEPGLLSLSVGKNTHYYVFMEIPCTIGGRGFVMHRLGMGDVYHVRVGQPEDISCECLGFYRHGKCKHVLALAALVGHELI